MDHFVSKAKARSPLDGPEYCSTSLGRCDGGGVAGGGVQGGCINMSCSLTWLGGTCLG